MPRPTDRPNARTSTNGEVTAAAAVTSPRLRALTYCRISHDPTGREAGVERQRKDTDGIARRERWDVLARFVDNDRSASRYATRDREDWLRAMAMIEAGAVDAVVVYDLDRFVRQPKELERLIDAADRGLLVRTAIGEIDLATSAGRMVARTLCNVAAHEADRISERQKAKLRHDAENGRPHWPQRPFGYTMAGDIEPSEAAWIHKMASWLIDDRMTATAIAGRLNAEGIRTTTGKAWQFATVKGTLTSPRTAGLREYHGEILYDVKASWAPILDRIRWEQVRAAIELRSTGPRPSGRRSMLTRLLRCGRCGQAARPLSRNGTTDGPLWRCLKRPDGGCGLSVTAIPVESFIVRSAIDAIEALPIERRGRSERPDDVDALRSELDAIAALKGEGDLSMSEWLAARKPLQRRLEAAVAAQSAADHADLTASLRRHSGGVRAGWEELDIDARRRVIASMVEYIEILPASISTRHRFDPDRIVIHWRG